MINYRQIGNLQEQIFDQIGAAESFRSFVYHDSVGVPTLGYGFALLVRDESDRYVIRDDLSGALSAIDIEIDGEFQNTLDEAIDLLNAGNVAGSSALFPGPNANIADDPSLNTMGITIDENEGRTLFNYAAADAVANLWGRLRISGDDSLFNVVAGQEASVDYTTRSAVKQAYIDGDIPGTKEFVALVSLAYNGPELIGDNLRTALAEGNRTAAWFEIRYASNEANDPGAAKRRYHESQLFGLYNVGETSEQAAARIISFLYQDPVRYPGDSGNPDRHNLDTIIRKEELFANTTGNTFRAIADYGLEGDAAALNYGDIFKFIAKELLSYHIADYLASENVPATNVFPELSGDLNLGVTSQFVSTSAPNDPEAMLQPLYRVGLGTSPSNDLDTNGTPLTGVNDWLIAVNGSQYQIQGLYGDDILVGADQADVIYGGY